VQLKSHGLLRPAASRHYDTAVH